MVNKSTQTENLQENIVEASTLEQRNRGMDKCNGDADRNETKTISDSNVSKDHCSKTIKEEIIETKEKEDNNSNSIISLSQSNDVTTSSENQYSDDFYENIFENILENDCVKDSSSKLATLKRDESRKSKSTRTSKNIKKRKSSSQAKTSDGRYC